MIRALLACAALLTACGACAASIPRPTFTGTDVREHAVSVAVACSGKTLGSGVIVDARRVLTAAHVVPCGTAATVAVRTRDGRVVPARVTWVDDGRDVAVLRATADLEGPYPVIAPATHGRVCLVPGWPTRRVSCGYVTGTGLEIRHTAKTARGNSGSGLYDARGRLIGVVTNRTDAGGIATALIVEALP